jgi:hypothetical protein
MFNRTIGRSYNTREVADIRGGSVVSLRRAVREGKYAQPDFYHGPYAYWTEETVLREREREIRESAARVAHRRAAQLEAAERARAAKKRKPNDTDKEVAAA